MKKLFYMVAFVLVCGLTAAAVMMFSASGPVSDQDAVSGPEYKAELSGFKPGSEVSYKIFPHEQTPGHGRSETVSGRALVNEQGAMEIPSYTLSDGETAFTYDLVIREEKDDEPLQVIFTFNPEDGKAVVLGKGMGAFSDVDIKTPLESHETAADWAGLLKTPYDTNFFVPEGQKIMELALFNNNIASDVAGQHPKIIQVLSAQGGGGPGPGGVNVWSPTYCGSPVKISTCVPGAMNGHIFNIVQNYVVAFMKMTEQFSAVMMQQMQILGSFFDAKMQLETQREFEALKAEAHKDYHPSDQMCQFGSFVRSVSRTESKVDNDVLALNEVLMGVYSSQEHRSSAEGYAIDIEARIKQFREDYCNPADNNSGLSYMCDHDQDGDPGTGPTGATIPDRVNKDIDYARTLGSPLTVNLNFTNGGESNDEKDVLALARNLYWPRVPNPSVPKVLPDIFVAFQQSRSLQAKYNVAHNSFAHLAAMKGRAANGLAEDSGWAFMKALLRDFGIEDEEIHGLLGNQPSYYAQMEVLTKKIYQNPDFYTNLYDKPTNVKRIGASIDAIKLMQDRDEYEGALRREMLLSLMVENRLKKHYKLINAGMADEIKNLE